MRNRKPFITIILFFPILALIFLTMDVTRGDSPLYVLKSKICNPQSESAIRNSQSAIRNPQPAICNPQSAIQYAPFRDITRHISSMNAPSSTSGMRRDAPARRSSLAIGEEKALVILIEFTDVKHSPTKHNRDYFYNLLFSKTPGDKSMYNYYQECSYGQFLISPGNDKDNPTIWLMSDYTLSYYNNLEENSNLIWKLAEEAMQKAAKAGIDFSSYDEDKDKLVDHLIIIHAGGAEEDTNYQTDLSSHRWEIPSGQYAHQGYTLQAETSPLGIFAHEFGHDLGLPDLYVSSNHFLVHDWSLMDHGAWLGNPPGSSPAHPCAWSKTLLGWITPKEAPSCGPAREVLAIETHKEESLFKLSTANQDEYFLVSNRRRTGFDAYLPGEGILIWHIDDKVGSIEANNVNSNYFYPRVYLEQADNREDLRDNRGADAGDPYFKTVANDRFRFDDNTSPNSRDYKGNPTGIEIRVLDPPGERMTVLMKNKCRETASKTCAAPNPFVIRQHSDEKSVGIYLEPAVPNPTLSIYDLNGQLVHTEAGGETLSDDKSDSNRFTWDGKNDAGRPVGSGVYIYVIKSEKETMTGKLAVIR